LVQVRVQVAQFMTHLISFDLTSIFPVDFQLPTVLTLVFAQSKLLHLLWPLPVLHDVVVCIHSMSLQGQQCCLKSQDHLAFPRVYPIYPCPVLNWRFQNPVHDYAKNKWWQNATLSDTRVNVEEFTQNWINSHRKPAAMVKTYLDDNDLSGIPYLAAMFHKDSTIKSFCWSR